MIEIIVNGSPTQVEPDLTLDALLDRLQLAAGRVAVERNRQVIPRQRHTSEPVEPGDRFEIVTLVGGG